MEQHLTLQSLVGCAALCLLTGCGAFQSPPRAVVGTPSVEMTIETEELRLSNGVRIPSTHRILNGDGPIILAVHGLGGYAGDFRHLIDDFSAHGLSVVAVDLRGLGRWPGPRGDIENAGVWLGDLNAIVVGLRSRYPGRAVVLLGESMGAAVAAWYQSEQGPQGTAGVDALVAYSVVVDPQIKPGFFRTLGLGFAYTFTPRKQIRVEADPSTISTDVDFQQRYTSDPAMTRRASLRFLGQVRKIVRRAPGRFAGIEVPLLIVQPGDDIFSSAKGRARLREKVPQAAYEEIEDCKHAMINDTCRDRVFAITRRWLDEHVTGP